MAEVVCRRLAAVQILPPRSHSDHKYQCQRPRAVSCSSEWQCGRTRAQESHSAENKGPSSKLTWLGKTKPKFGRPLRASAEDASLSLNEPSVLVGDGGGFGRGGSGQHGGGGDWGGAGDGWSDDGQGGNSAEALSVLTAVGRTLDSFPADLANAIKEGRIPKHLIERYLALEQNPLAKLFLGFAGFRERLLADELFLTKVAIECGVGMFTKTAAELERRREKFGAELDFVIADVIMALLADFMLVWLPAPTVSLRAAPALNAGRIAKFFFNCPDNAFQIPMPGVSYSLLQRAGAIVRNGAKLFVVGTGASLVGTLSTNGLILLRIKLNPGSEGSVEPEDIPVLATSAAYGAYMAISSNLRYQLLAGVIEQRMLEPLLHKRKFLLGASSFVLRTGNTFLGSLMWVDYARLVGIQGGKE